MSFGELESDNDEEFNAYIGSSGQLTNDGPSICMALCIRSPLPTDWTATHEVTVLFFT